MDLRRSSIPSEVPYGFTRLPAQRSNSNNSNNPLSNTSDPVVSNTTAPGGIIISFARKFNSTSKSFTNLNRSDPSPPHANNEQCNTKNIQQNQNQNPLPEKKKPNIFNFRSSKKSAINVSPNFKFNES